MGVKVVIDREKPAPFNPKIKIWINMLLFKYICLKYIIIFLEYSDYISINYTYIDTVLIKI